MALSQKQTGNVIMFFVASIFAINIPISKVLLSDYISPFGLTISRMLFAAIAFWIVSLFTKHEKIAKKDHLTILFGGLLGIAINQGLFIYGLEKTSPVDASIIITSGPLFAMIIAALILKEPITGKKLSGVLIGGIGAIFLVYSAHHGDIVQASSMKGNLSVVSSAFCYALYLVITRPLTERYSPITLMKWMFLYSTIVLLPFTYNDIIEAKVFHQPDALPYALLFYTLFGATFITYMLIPVAQRRIRPTTVSMYNNLQPLIASFIAIILGMDTFSVEKLISGALIFLGVYLVTISKSKKDIDAEKKLEQQTIPNK